jgi:hypothetical protein
MLEHEVVAERSNYSVDVDRTETGIGNGAVCRLECDTPRVMVRQDLGLVRVVNTNDRHIVEWMSDHSSSPQMRTYERSSS